MRIYESGLSRRTLLKSAVASAIAMNLHPAVSIAANSSVIKKKIPSTGEEIPVMGMGTFKTFDVGNDPEARAELTRVLELFFDNGGEVIDSSPMYGNSESVIGDLLAGTGWKDSLFAATKVYIRGRDAGIRQMHESMQKMGVEVMDLMQVHNLVDWQTHLPTLYEWKKEGRIRYTGITTWDSRKHDEFEKIMASEPVDFVQFTYSLENRTAEQRLLPLARDRGIATLINVPFGKGRMFNKVKGKSLPAWAAEFDCNSWAQFFLKYLISHPQVTCVIPATSNPRHMADNMGAGFGRLPDPETRKRMEALYDSL